MGDDDDSEMPTSAWYFPRRVGHPTRWTPSCPREHSLAHKVNRRKGSRASQQAPFELGPEQGPAPTCQCRGVAEGEPPRRTPGCNLDGLLPVSRQPGAGGEHARSRERVCVCVCVSRCSHMRMRVHMCMRAIGRCERCWGLEGVRPEGMPARARSLFSCCPLHASCAQTMCSARVRSRPLHPTRLHQSSLPPSGWCGATTRGLCLPTAPHSTHITMHACQGTSLHPRDHAVHARLPRHPTPLMWTRTHAKPPHSTHVTMLSTHACRTPASSSRGPAHPAVVASTAPAGWVRKSVCMCVLWGGGECTYVCACVRVRVCACETCMSRPSHHHTM